MTGRIIQSIWRLLITTRPWDAGPEVDLYYLRNRWYGPTAGRFWSEDPIGLAGGINPYTFAGNDPVNGKDPIGLFCGGWWLTVQINFATIMTNIGGTGVAAYNIPVSCVDWEPLIGSLDADAVFSQSASKFDQFTSSSGAQLQGTYAGELAELRCTGAVLWAEANFALDLAGLKAFVGLARPGVTAVDFVTSWAWRAVTEGVSVGVPLGLAESRTTGELKRRDLGYVTAVAFVGYATAFAPGASFLSSAFGARNVCGVNR